jgi:hypothetical protein
MTLMRRPGLRRPRGSKATLTAFDFERAKTWLPTIVEACLTDPEWHQEGDERKYRHTGGLSINMKGRGWYDHSAKLGGSSAITLNHQLHKIQSIAAAASSLRKPANFWGRFSDPPPPLFRPTEGTQGAGRVDLA